jgi:hypothetical protein
MSIIDDLRAIIDRQNSEITRLRVALQACRTMTFDITYDEHVIIDSLWDVAVPLNANVAFMTDHQWYGINKEDVETVLTLCQNIKDETYIESVHDCDDYAQALHGVFNQYGLSGYAFGYASSGGHAFNFFVDREKKIWLVEPQTLEILDYDLYKHLDSYNIINWII